MYNIEFKLGKTKGGKLWMRCVRVSVCALCGIRFDSIQHIYYEFNQGASACEIFHGERCSNDAKCERYSKNSKHIYGFEHAIPFCFGCSDFSSLSILFGFDFHHSRSFSRIARSVINISLY